jgi:hypothetical protein
MFMHFPRELQPLSRHPQTQELTKNSHALRRPKAQPALQLQSSKVSFRRAALGLSKAPKNARIAAMNGPWKSASVFPRRISARAM